jgi:hypothetical protein
MADGDRPPPREEMILSGDSMSLRRGRRIAPRTPVCRACLVWPEGAPDIELKGVVINLTPHGVLLRMLDSLPMGSRIRLQMMRDDEFREPLSVVLQGKIMRNTETDSGFVDHGVQIDRRPINQQESRPVQYRPPVKRETPRTRMHTIDLRVGGGPPRRTGERP